MFPFLSCTLSTGARRNCNVSGLVSYSASSRLLPSLSVLLFVSIAVFVHNISSSSPYGLWKVEMMSSQTPSKYLSTPLKNVKRFYLNQNHAIHSSKLLRNKPSHHGMVRNNKSVSSTSSNIIAHWAYHDINLIKIHYECIAFMTLQWEMMRYACMT